MLRLLDASVFFFLKTEGTDRIVPVVAFRSIFTMDRLNTVYIMIYIVGLLRS